MQRRFQFSSDDQDVLSAAFSFCLSPNQTKISVKALIEGLRRCLKNENQPPSPGLRASMAERHISGQHFQKNDPNFNFFSTSQPQFQTPKHSPCSEQIANIPKRENSTQLLIDLIQSACIDEDMMLSFDELILIFENYLTNFLLENNRTNHHNGETNNNDERNVDQNQSKDELLVLFRILANNTPLITLATLQIAARALNDSSISVQEIGELIGIAVEVENRLVIFNDDRKNDEKNIGNKQRKYVNSVDFERFCVIMRGEE
jgi:hypothetical protein